MKLCVNKSHLFEVLLKLYMQKINKDYEERVNTNKKLRCKIEQQKLKLQDMEIKLASLKSKSTY